MTLINAKLFIICNLSILKVIVIPTTQLHGVNELQQFYLYIQRIILRKRMFVTDINKIAILN